ncbi:hypothetical protein JCGZ_08636 [Jatropha curcas]|uniref:Uncharacterized protein n=1 Tax=Jatropha curcas TaxID=180498 RepID=A0A067J922_JATCU|nr:hypothetical protein JCGZ_08636 [Jatropha curcas]
MAPSLLKLTTILSVLLLLLVSFHTQKSLAAESEDDEEYILDTPLPNFRSRSSFLARVIRKGTRCNALSSNICNGVYANNGTSLLYCCKSHCRNVLGDQNNCGECGSKCKFGERCCHGSCISVAYDANNCGGCNKKCPPGVPCNYGVCGYA